MANLPTVYQLFAWKVGQARGGFDDFIGAYASITQAEHQLLSQRNGVDTALIVALVNGQPLVKTRYALSICWMDEQGCPRIDAAHPRWVRIGDLQTPMQEVTFENRQEQTG